MIVKLTENNGTKYSIPNCNGDYILPRTEFLLHHVKSIETKIIKWFKEKHYSQGDDYVVDFTKNGKWRVSYFNDYPLQHSNDKSVILTPEEFLEATK